MREVAFISKHITFLAEKKKNVVNEWMNRAVDKWMTEDSVLVSGLFSFPKIVLIMIRAGERIPTIFQKPRFYSEGWSPHFSELP